MAQSYEVMRCDFIDKQGQDFQEKIKHFIIMLKDSLTSKELSRQIADEAVHQAISFFNQPLPTISENSKPTDVANDDSSPASDLRDDISELKKDVSNLTQTMVTYRKKYKKLMAEGKRKETAYRLSVHVLEKKLSSLRKLIKINNERQKMDVPLEWDDVDGDATNSDRPTQEATASTNVSQRLANDTTLVDISTVEDKLLAEPAAVELTSIVPTAPPRPPQTLLGVKLEPMSCHTIKTPGETTEITDFKTAGVFIFVAKQGKLDEFVMPGRFEQPIAQFQNCKFGFMSGDMIVASHLQEVILFRKESITSSKFVWKKIRTLFKCPKPDEILAIVCRSYSSIAVATTKNIFLLDNKGTFLGIIEIQKPLIDMLSSGEDNLVLWDSQKFIKIDVYTGKPVKEVEHEKSFCSLSYWKDGNFFALDSDNKTLYLFGPDMETIHQKWSLGNQLRDEDQLLRVSVADDKCLCVTKFGFLYHFKITLEKGEI